MGDINIAIAEAPGHCDGRARVWSVYPDTAEGKRAAYGELKTGGRTVAAYRCGVDVGDRIPLHIYSPIDIAAELERERLAELARRDERERSARLLAQDAANERARLLAATIRYDRDRGEG